MIKVNKQSHRIITVIADKETGQRDRQTPSIQLRIRIRPERLMTMKGGIHFHVDTDEEEMRQIGKREITVI